MTLSRRAVSSSIALVIMGLGVGLAAVVRPVAAPGSAPAGAAVVAEASVAGAALAHDLVWADSVEHALDHISPEDLATRVIENPASTVLIDVRPPDEFAAFHLLGAQNLSLPDVLGPTGQALIAAAGDRLVVLYSNGMTHPAQAWAALSARGITNVRVLEDGLDGLLARVLTPPSLRAGTTEARAQADRPAFQAAMAAFVGSAPVSDAAGHGQHGVYATDPASLTAPTVVSAGWVKQHLGSVVVIDAREADDAFASGHIPGAIHLPFSSLRATVDAVPEQVRPATELAERLGQAGIDADASVVIYAGDHLHDATQTLVAMLLAGHERVAILEGGLEAWSAAGDPVDVAVTTRAPTAYVARPVSKDLATTLGDVVASLQQHTSAVLDVRPSDAFEGNDAKGSTGHMPGAFNRPVEADVVMDSGTWWRPREELLAAYGALGLSANKPVIVTCRTGHRASLTYFTLRFVLGWTDARWYDGSFEEWAGHHELPVASGAART